MTPQAYRSGADITAVLRVHVVWRFWLRLHRTNLRPATGLRPSPRVLLMRYTYVR